MDYCGSVTSIPTQILQSLFFNIIFYVYFYIIPCMHTMHLGYTYFQLPPSTPPAPILFPNSHLTLLNKITTQSNQCCPTRITETGSLARLELAMQTRLDLNSPSSDLKGVCYHIGRHILMGLQGAPLPLSPLNTLVECCAAVQRPAGGNKRSLKWWSSGSALSERAGSRGSEAICCPQGLPSLLETPSKPA